MEEPPNSEFLKGLSGGTVANLIFAVGFLVYRVFSNKCKHCKCKSKTGCLECSSQEDSITSKEDHDEHKIRREFEENLQNLLGKLNSSLSEKREKVIRANTLRRRPSGLSEMDKGEISEGQV